MALPILDGNQTAATLSTVLTSGEHIPAHTVVSLGSQAITDVRSAVSGSVVSISNFPASQGTTFGAVTGSVSVLNFPSTQTIAGTVTARTDLDAYGNSCVVVAFESPAGIQRVANVNGFPIRAMQDEFGTSIPLPISGTVTIGNSVTIGSLPAISGTVTANAILQNANAMAQAFIDESDAYGAVGVNIVNSTNNIGVVGTVTAAAPNGSLTTRFGTPTTANVSFATSAVTNANRKYLLIQNVTTGSNVITVGIGFTPTTTQGIQLTAGAGITFESSYIPTGQIFVLSSVTASNFTILEA